MGSTKLTVAGYSTQQLPSEFRMAAWYSPAANPVKDASVDQLLPPSIEYWVVGFVFSRRMKILPVEASQSSGSSTASPAIVADAG